MTTKVISPSPSLSIDAPQQNEHLWKIIEKQRSIIQELQLNLAKVTEERDLLLKQTAQPASPQSSPSAIDIYSRRPLPVEPSPSPETTTAVTTNDTTDTATITDTTTSTTPITNPTRNNTTTPSPFDLMFSSDEPMHASPGKKNNDLSHILDPTEDIDGDCSEDEDIDTKRKNSAMDEKDIMLYTKYHEAVRSRHTSQPYQTESSMITHSPLPPPPQRHGAFAQRQHSAPTIPSASQPPTSAFLTGSVSSSKSITATPITATPSSLSGQQQQQQPSYTLQKFMDEDQSTSITSYGDHASQVHSSTVATRSTSQDMVRYEDGYYDPSLEDESGQTTGSALPASPGTPHSSDQPSTPSTPVPMLTDITIQVLSSNMTTNEKGKEIFSFTIAIGKISPSLPHGMEELWRSEKLLSDFVTLDHMIKTKNPALASSLCRLPDKSLFISKAPSKVDERKHVIQVYLQHVLTLPLTDMSDLCEFLSTNVLEQRTGPPKKKVGYLTKRGKNFGGWKMRFFVLDGPTVNYFENKGGQYLGTINLSRAQIGRQVVQSGSGDAFRHAFLILEPKKSAPNGIHRHVLCADSDLERDQWVEAMSQYINYDDFGQPPPSTPTTDYRQQLNKYLRRTRSDTGNFKKNRKNSAQRHVRQRSSLDGADLMQHHGMDDEKKQNNKSRPFWGKKKLNNNDNNLPSLQGGLSADQATAMMNSVGFMDLSDNKPVNYGPNQVFGIPLEDAVQVCRISHDYELPAVVYRCIEYLEAKDAAQEEGIYRLSGSAAKIRKLKEKFNQEGDVLLLELEEYNHEVHAIAGLLKMWLRELPGSVLTMELLNEFLQVADIEDRERRTTELGRLVSLLPICNYTLLRTLSAHLIRIVQNAGVNKMTLRNLGIVFSATLGIPAVIFNLFLSEFDYVFWTKGSNDQSVLPPPSSNASSSTTSHQQQQQQTTTTTTTT
ncbi:uncharacterized protein BX664DRAFT_287375, partial [Halteromyces radiatus]|uniref:uncharacterized protein n=1 Tax=Halteromyces radiatus TaxID=101107 RepID=UPI00221EE59B